LCNLGKAKAKQKINTITIYIIYKNILWLAKLPAIFLSIRFETVFPQLQSIGGQARPKFGNVSAKHHHIPSRIRAVFFGENSACQIQQLDSSHTSWSIINQTFVTQTHGYSDALTLPSNNEEHVGSQSPDFPRFTNIN
jgi:hypothetical protein